MRNAQFYAALVVIAALLVLPAVFAATDQIFYVDVLRRIVILSIAVASLDLLLGYGGLVSVGQTAFIGIGAYTVAISSFYGIDNAGFQLLLTVLGSAFFAVLMGSVALRVSGIPFIMVTLASSQIFYYIAVSAKTYGGDDGLATAKSDFGGVLDLGNSLTFYYVCLAVLLAVLLFFRWLIRSRFGAVLEGFRINERRMSALGFPKIRYQLAAFVISGVVCGLAGFLLANHTEYVSPDFIHWSRSGDMLIMLILGGKRSLVGAVVGVAFYLGFEQVLGSYTHHWQLLMAPILLAVILKADGGLFGIFRNGGAPAIREAEGTSHAA
jgi:branched-chain amino acid transport system permease protein